MGGGTEGRGEEGLGGEEGGNCNRDIKEIKK